MVIWLHPWSNRSEGTVICRLCNSWEWTIVEHLATKLLEAIFTWVQMWLVKFTGEERTGLWGSPHTTIAEWEAIVGKHRGMIAVFLHTCWGMRSGGWDIKLLRPFSWPRTGISYIPNPRVKMETKGSQSEQKELQNAEILSYVSMPQCGCSHLSCWFPVEILVRQDLDLRTCRS